MPEVLHAGGSTFSWRSWVEPLVFYWRNLSVDGMRAAPMSIGANMREIGVCQNELLQFLK